MAVMTMALAPVDRVRVAHATEDWAGNWYGPQGGLTFSRADCARYVSEGHLSTLCDRHTLQLVWRTVAEYLEMHPEILKAGRLSDSQRQQKQAQRDAAARALLAEAEEPFRAGRWGEALDLVDRAELASPDAADYALYRKVITERRPVEPATAETSQA